MSALYKEMESRSNFFDQERIDTIYLGGGTPSVLNTEEIKEIILRIRQNYRMADDIEITMEVNPDDITPTYLDQLETSGVNRISMGIQALQDPVLKWLERRHDSGQARQVLHALIRRERFDISIDLIYGLPDMGTDAWKETVEWIGRQPIGHVSAYHLTIEKNTPLHSRWVKREFEEVKEDESLNQYEQLVKILNREGFEQYEISNFARDKKYSRHNMKYWTGDHYLGLGPSAHSYDGERRYWNVSDIKAYIQDPSGNRSHEELDEATRWNEYIMTGLRTRWGIILPEKKQVELLEMAKPFLLNGEMEYDGSRIRLTSKGFFRSDGIMARFFTDAS